MSDPQMPAKHLRAKAALETNDVIRLYRASQRQGITSNQILSQKRAENVMEFLLSQGAKPDLISAKGFGDADPVASNDTAQGRAQNRRVELSVPASGC
jgi:flagellar motor protein MotB